MVVETLNQLFFHAIKTYDKADALKGKKDEVWVAISATEMAKAVRNLSLGLISLGLEREDRVSLLSENRPEWAISDYAVLTAGGIDVPIYSTLIPKQIEYIINNSESKFIIVSTKQQFDKIMEIRDHIKHITHIITIEDLGVNRANVLTIDQVMKKGEALAKEQPDLHEKRANEVKADDVASFIYTSGTTGDPKGVMLMHSNIVSNVIAACEVLPLTTEDVALSFLPLCHIFERMVDYALFYRGATIAYAENIDTVPQNLVEVSPTVVASVPRLYEKMYARVMDMAATGSPLKKKIFNWAVKTGDEYAQTKLSGKEVSGGLKFRYGLATKLVFSKLQARTGGKLRFFISGGAPLAKDIGEFFYGAGITILEGYGLTETSPVICVNRPDRIKFGTVGPPVQKVDVKIAEDGEILTRGPHIMKGYFKLPDKTAEVIDRDGWFYTGDIGLLDKDNYLTITDRKKDLIVTSGGKNVAPQPIENVLKTNKFIEQVSVVGNKRKFISALVVPSFENLENYAREMGIEFSGRSDLVNNPKINEFMMQQINEATPNLAQFEKIKKITLIDKEFTLEAGEITPTMKIKRNVVEKKYTDMIDQMYVE